MSRMCQEVCINPAFFDFVGKNQKGMQAAESVDPETLAKFKAEWEDLGKHVASVVKHWSDDYGIHKQTLNRALEPWLYMRTLVTATEFDNFFKLRLAKDAQPEMRSLAQAMVLALCKATAVESPWHIPYADITEDSKLEELPEFIVRSVAACARVSILRGDEKKTTYEEDEAFVRRLLDAKHMSPFEHVALTTGGEEGMAYNLEGWQSLRFILDNGYTLSDFLKKFLGDRVANA